MESFKKNASYIRQNNVHALPLKWKISVISLVEAACIFLIILIATVQISMGCKTQENQATSTKHLNLY